MKNPHRIVVTPPARLAGTARHAGKRPWQVPGRRPRLAGLAAGAVLVLAQAGCTPQEPDGWQGYLEAEFVQVGAPLAGRLQTLSVHRGGQVELGAPLFALDDTPEQAALAAAEHRVAAAQARLEDLRKGARPSEVEALAARLAGARAQAEWSRHERERLEALFASNNLSATEIDRARLAHERDLLTINELTAQLETARLGGRTDALAAAAAEVAAAAAARDQAAWAVSEKAQVAPVAGRVFDTWFLPGEMVPAGSPVVALLPPTHVRVRFFVAESDLAEVAPGTIVRVARTGKSALEARVTQVSPRPEFTPPVLYNRANRAKLVYRVEAVFSARDAMDLHPGQPVDVSR